MISYPLKYDNKLRNISIFSIILVLFSIAKNNLIANINEISVVHNSTHTFKKLPIIVICVFQVESKYVMLILQTFKLFTFV